MTGGGCVYIWELFEHVVTADVTRWQCYISYIHNAFHSNASKCSVSEEMLHGCYCYRAIVFEKYPSLLFSPVQFLYLVMRNKHDLSTHISGEM